MALWLLFILILLSASGILALTFGPLKTAPSAAALRAVAGVQVLAALLLLGARLTGRA